MSGFGSGGYGVGMYGTGRSPNSGTLLDRHLGPEALVVTIGGQLCALSDTGPVTIRHGRTSTDQAPDPATCTLTVRTSTLPALPSIGDPVTVELGEDAADWLAISGSAWDAVKTRFTGRITDLTAAPARGDVQGEQLLSVIAVSDRARLGRVVLGDTPWPAETDGARAGRILELAAVNTPLTLGTSDPGTVTVLARDVDRQPALGLLEDLAVYTGGVLGETRAGELRWLDAEHRNRDTPPAVTLDASSVLAASTTSTLRVGELLNDLTVLYGSSDPRGTVRVQHAGSISQHTRHAASIDTRLADADEAETFARTLLARRSRPRWSTPAMTVDLVRTVDVALAAALLALEFGDLVAVTGYPAAGPFSSAQLWLEGWTETITAREWRLALDVSDYALTVSPLRWSEVDPDTSWAEVPADLRWLDTRADLTGA